MTCMQDPTWGRSRGAGERGVQCYPPGGLTRLGTAKQMCQRIVEMTKEAYHFDIESLGFLRTLIHEGSIRPGRALSQKTLRETASNSGPKRSQKTNPESDWDSGVSDLGPSRA
jgi:hypothetical protein